MLLPPLPPPPSNMDEIDCKAVMAIMATPGVAEQYINGPLKDNTKKSENAKSDDMAFVNSSAAA